MVTSDAASRTDAQPRRKAAPEGDGSALPAGRAASATVVSLAAVRKAMPVAPEAAVETASFADPPSNDAEADDAPPTTLGLNHAERAMKRLFDLASVVVILALFWWAIIGVAIAVRLTTGSPVIYGHRRIGRGGREFACYKFRSMVPNADEVLAHLLATSPAAREEWNRDFKLKDDPRVTRVGRFIRRTSLDEFPQLWNVVRNDMSIVGPRPVVRKEVDQHYHGVFRTSYLSVKPGLTGLWQVSGRNDMSYQERVELDRDYVYGWNVFRDLALVMRTVNVMFRRKGAY